MRYRYLRFPGGKYKAVTLSYDDGVRFDLPLLDISDRYGIKCTLNVTGSIGDENRLSRAELRERVVGCGHEVAVHGMHHIAPGAAATAATVVGEFLECRKLLEGILGRIVRGMAYPDFGITRMHGGHSYPEIRAILESIGIAYSRTLSGDNDRFLLPEDFYAWMPTAHHENPALLDYVKSFLALSEPAYGAAQYPRLFYLWGHSYEFDRNRNWDRLERFCAEIGGREDTWYATNIEICDYVRAYHAIVASADGHTLHNPTARHLWLVIDGEPCELAPGMTKTFP